MFTGIIQKLGTLRQRARAGDSWSLAIACGAWDEPLQPGESVAVQGVCLTATRPAGEGGFWADLLDETLSRTAFQKLPDGAVVNLERALRLSDRLGGHMVTGHVDETGLVTRIETRGRNRVLRVACSAGLARTCVPKGSIALDGVSLTLTAVGGDWLEVHLIPHTWQNTSLRDRKPGDPVNVESDLVAKHLYQFTRSAAPANLTESLLKNAGF